MCENVRIEELAYSLGYRVTKEGKLYNLNGNEYKVVIRAKRESHCFRRNNKTHYFSLIRLQGYQKFGEAIYNYRQIDVLNADPLNASLDNVVLGKGSERIDATLLKMRKEERAYALGYRVDNNGVLFLQGNNVSEKVRLTNWGYQFFEIPRTFKNMEVVLVHRLQAFQKYGTALYEAECVRHLNDVKRDNTPDNIALGTIKDNASDINITIKAQQYLKSAKKQIKYPVELRNKWRRLYTKGERVCDLSRKYDVPHSSMKAIVQNISII